MVRGWFPPSLCTAVQFVSAKRVSTALAPKTGILLALQNNVRLEERGELMSQVLVSARCQTVASGDLHLLCDELSRQIDSLRTPLISVALVAALLSVAAAILSPTIAGRMSRRNEKTTRHDTAQREAVYAAQDLAAKQLKQWTQVQEWLSNDPEGTPRPVSESVETAKLASFRLAVGRIQDPTVRNDMHAWSDYAQNYFNEADDFNESGHEELWNRVIESSNAYVLRLSGN